MPILGEPLSTSILAIMYFGDVVFAISGQIYATAALLGSLSYALLRYFQAPEIAPEAIACLSAFSLRAAAIVCNIRIGPPGEFIRLGAR